MKMRSNPSCWRKATSSQDKLEKLSILETKSSFETVESLTGRVSIDKTARNAFIKRTFFCLDSQKAEKSKKFVYFHIYLWRLYALLKNKVNFLYLSDNLNAWKVNLEFKHFFTKGHEFYKLSICQRLRHVIGNLRYSCWRFEMIFNSKLLGLNGQKRVTHPF